MSSTAQRVSRYATAIAAILSCFFVGDAKAGFTSGNELWDCLSKNDPDFCQGYVLGAAETYTALQLANQVTYFCVPAGAEKGQVLDVVKLFLRDHPETRQKSAPTLVMIALREKFPCQEGGQDGEKTTPRPDLPPGFGPARPQ